MIEITAQEKKYLSVGAMEKLLLEKTGALGPIDISMIAVDSQAVYVIAGNGTGIKTVEAHDISNGKVTGMFGTYHLRKSADGELMLVNMQNDGRGTLSIKSSHFSYGKLFSVPKGRITPLGYDM